MQKTPLAHPAWVSEGLELRRAYDVNDTRSSLRNSAISGISVCRPLGVGLGVGTGAPGCWIGASAIVSVPPWLPWPPWLAAVAVSVGVGVVLAVGALGDADGEGEACKVHA